MLKSEMEEKLLPLGSQKINKRSMRIYCGGDVEDGNRIGRPQASLFAQTQLGNYQILLNIPEINTKTGRKTPQIKEKKQPH